MDTDRNRSKQIDTERTMQVDAGLLLANAGRCRPMQADARRYRPIQDESGRCRPMQADAARFRPNQAEEGRCRSMEIDADGYRWIQIHTDRYRSIQIDRCRLMRADAG